MYALPQWEGDIDLHGTNVLGFTMICAKKYFLNNKGNIEMSELLQQIKENQLHKGFSFLERDMITSMRGITLEQLEFSDRSRIAERFGKYFLRNELQNSS